MPRKHGMKEKSLIQDWFDLDRDDQEMIDSMIEKEELMRRKRGMTFRAKVTRTQLKYPLLLFYLEFGVACHEI
jgi:hypothetical protein